MTTDDWANTHRAVYDDYAQQYADNTADFARFPGLRNDLDSFASLVPPGGTVLDAGCGAGRDLNMLLEAGTPGLGIDLSQGLLREGHRRFPRLRGHTAQADVLALPLAHASVAGIWCSGLLVNAPHNAAPTILAEFSRVLHDHGILDLSIKQGDDEFWSHEGQIPGRRLTTLWEPAELIEHAEAHDLDHQRTITPSRPPWAIVRFRRLRRPG